MLNLNKIYNIECLEGMKLIADKSIDMIFVDLPYQKTHNSWDVMIPFQPMWEQFERLYSWDIPFALIMNMNGIFDSKQRYEMFKDKTVEFLIPKGRMKFFTEDGVTKNSPNFQSIYVCSKMLDKQIKFSESEF